MPSSAAAYAPLAGADEQQPLAAAAVERDDAEAPDDAEAGAPRDTAADDSESEPEPSEAAEQPKEEEEEEEQEPAEDEADGTDGSVAAAAATPHARISCSHCFFGRRVAGDSSAVE